MSTDLERWLAMARTPQTRARIRLWALLKRVFFVLAIVGAGAFAVAVVGFLLLGFAGLFVPDLRVVTDVPWWLIPAVIVIPLAMILPWCVASALLEAACYLDGTESLGTITEVVVDTTSDIEGQPQYDLSITADLDQKSSIRRCVRTSERAQPQVGQTVRFLHNTRDPEDLQDILYLGVVGDGGLPGPSRPEEP